MKNNVKYTVLPRVCALLCALVLLLTAMAVPAAAASNSGYVTWTYDETADTLTAYFPATDTETVYVRYGDHPRLRYDPLDDFVYNKTLKIDGVTHRIHAPAMRSETVVVINPQGDYRIYVTKTQKQRLDNLLDMRTATPSLTYTEDDEIRYSDMSKSFMTGLRDLKDDSEVQRLTGSLHEFRYAPRYELWAYDKDDYLAANVGMLFDLAGEMYYLDVFDLPASAFAEDGTLVPSESVTVTLYRLPKKMETNAYDAVWDAYSGWYETDYETSISSGDMMSEDEVSAALVYLSVIVPGILLPIAPFVLGLTLPHSRKQGYKKRWYLLTILGGAWMLMGILLLVLMIVAL